MNVGDIVLVSPDLTGTDQWIEGKIIEIEDNPFRGKVITVSTEEGDFFDVESSFRLPEYSNSI